MKPLATRDDLMAHLSYAPDTGEFVWTKSLSRVPSGHRAGMVDKHGYWRISFRNRQYQAHRLAWLFVYGEWPPIFIDHINGVRDDCRLVNLRLANRSENARNSKGRVRSVPKGVVIDQNRYAASIKVDKRTIYLGRFPTAEDAHAAYRAAAVVHFGEFARFE